MTRLDAKKVKARGRCRTCGKVFRLRQDYTLRGHGYSRFGDRWCSGSWLHPWFKVGDFVLSVINGTVARVKSVECVYGFQQEADRQSLVVTKVSGGWSPGWAKPGEEYPESNTEVVLYDGVL